MKNKKSFRNKTFSFGTCPKNINKICKGVSLQNKIIKKQKKQKKTKQQQPSWFKINKHQKYKSIQFYKSLNFKSKSNWCTFKFNISFSKSNLFFSIFNFFCLELWTLVSQKKKRKRTHKRKKKQKQITITSTQILATFIKQSIAPLEPD